MGSTPHGRAETGAVAFHDMQWDLVVSSRRIAVSDDTVPVLIGRSFDHPVLAISPLESGSVSRHHCEILGSGGQLWCRDLGSSNGTWVWRDGVSIRVGEELVQLQVGDQLRTVDNSVLCEISVVPTAGAPVATEAASPPPPAPPTA